jgi:hypothetical protein
MKFVILSSYELPFYNGVKGPIITPREYDIHLVLKWVATGVDIREVMEDGSFRKLEFNDSRLMEELDKDLERKRLENEGKKKEEKVEVKKPVPEKVNIFPSEPVKEVKVKPEPKVVVEEKVEVIEEEKKGPDFEIDEFEPID